MALPRNESKTVLQLRDELIQEEIPEVIQAFEALVKLTQETVGDFEAFLKCIDDKLDKYKK